MTDSHPAPPEPGAAEPFAVAPDVAQPDASKPDAAESKKVWPLLSALVLVAVNIAAALGLGLAIQAGWIQSFDGALGTIALFALYSTPYLATLLVVWAYTAIYRWPFADAVGLRAFDVLEGVALALAVAVGGRIFATAWAIGISALGFEPPENLDITALLPPDALGMILLGTLVVVIGPVAEEIVFRGVLYSAIRARSNVAIAAILSGALFGLIHIDLLWLVVPTAVLGAALALIYESTESLWVPILCHSVFNLTALVLTYLAMALGLV